MAQAIQPINRNYLPFQRSLQQQQGGDFKQWLNGGEPENDSNLPEASFESLSRPRTSLEDLLVLQQDNFGVANHSFAPHVETQNPYEVFAIPSDVETDGQYMFEFLTEALPASGEKVNQKI